MRELHNIEPVYDKNSKILILGSFPSVKSRETAFFYGHKQNRFWRLIARLCDENVPVTIDEKKSLLMRNRIAVWDVIKSCDISGSSDSSIKNAEINDFSVILNAADIRQIFANGSAAYNLYRKYVDDNIIKLPSTSPANAAWSIDKLADVWRVILDYIR